MEVNENYQALLPNGHERMSKQTNTKSVTAVEHGYIIVDEIENRAFINTLASNRSKAWENFCGPIVGVRKTWQKRGCRCVFAFVSAGFQLLKPGEKTK